MAAGRPSIIAVADPPPWRRRLHETIEMTEGHDITLLLQRVNDGEDGAMDALMGRVYEDLQRIAERRMRAQFGGQLPGVTLEPTALVNETYMRLIRQRQAFDNRGHFFAIATRMMLRVLMDYHRSRSAEKRGGGQVQVTLTGLAHEHSEDVTDIPQMVEAFDKLEAQDERAATVAKLRLLWGLGPTEIAETSRCRNRPSTASGDLLARGCASCSRRRADTDVSAPEVDSPAVHASHICSSIGRSTETSRLVEAIGIAGTPDGPFLSRRVTGPAKPSRTSHSFF